MTDNVDALRRIGVFASPKIAGTVKSAADEIEALRHALKQINRYSHKFVMEEQPAQQEKPQALKRPEATPSAWDKYLAMNLFPVHPTKFAFESMKDLSPEQRALFGYHKMTVRAWNLIFQTKLFDRQSITSALVEEIKCIENVGKVTLCEIARLRNKIILQHHKKAA